MRMTASRRFPAINPYIRAALVLFFTSQIMAAEEPGDEVRSDNANAIFEALSVDSGFAGRRINLDIRFELNSSRLTPEARKQLAELADALRRSGLDKDMIEIAGHTDSSGSDATNLALSKARAEAVRDYLVTTHGVDAGRLVASGYGERLPRAGRDASDPGNRRVELINHGQFASAAEILRDAEEREAEETDTTTRLQDLFR